MHDLTPSDSTSKVRPRRLARAATTLAFAAVLVAAGAGCSSSDDNSSGSSTPSPTAPAADDAKAVNDAFVSFFSGQTSGAEKISLVENGEAFADTINAQAESPLAKSASATVTNVDLDAPGHATVVYTISMNGQPALVDQMGEAVQVDGQWKVSQASFCALLTLEGNPPPVCGAPAGTGTPPTATPPPTSPAAPS